MHEVPSTAVLSVGYDLAALVAGAAPVQPFPEALERDDLARATEAIAAALERSGHAVVVYPEWLAEPTRRRLETIRAVLATDRLALRGCALPPLAGGILCNLASALTVQLTPGQLVAALDDLERELVVVAWLNSVTGLKRPAPSLLQHVGSLSPRSSFVVVLAPAQAVVRSGRAPQDLPLRKPTRAMELVVSAREGDDTTWLTDTLTAALGTLPIRCAAPTRHAALWWGTSRVAEVVAYPSDLTQLAGQLADRHRLRLCRWCSEAIASTPCPFCRGAEPQEGAGMLDRQAPAAS